MMTFVPKPKANGSSSVDLGPIEHRLDALEARLVVDLEPVAERLDVLEAHRSESDAYRPELRSRVGGLTLDSSTDELAPGSGFFTIEITVPGASYINITSYGQSIGELIAEIPMYDYDGFLEVILEGGHLVIRPADETLPLHVRTSHAPAALEAFDIDESWFGQDVYPRAAGIYDTTADSVRLTGPTNAYAPGSGQSVSTALEALKRLHHASDLVVHEEVNLIVPNGIDPSAYTVEQMGAAIGSHAYLLYSGVDDNPIYLEDTVVTDVSETVLSFLRRVPGVSDAYVHGNVFGQSVISFFTDVPWQFDRPTISGNYGYVEISGSAIWNGGSLSQRRVRTRLPSSDVNVSVYSDGYYAGGTLEKILQTFFEEILALRARVAQLESAQ